MGALDGRRILVTGASSGIGAACARAVAADGAQVALLARSPERLADLADEIDGIATPADVTDRSAVEAAVAQAVAAWGGLDGLVNAAGVARPGPLAEADPDDWRLTFDVNVIGLLEVTRASLEHLSAAPFADIVNVSSTSGRRRASVAMTVYSASKHAVHVLSDGMRQEFRDRGIRVTTLAPGFVRTPLFESVEDGALRDRYEASMQEKGLDVDDVARQVVHILRQPPDVDLIEVAVMSMRQPG